MKNKDIQKPVKINRLGTTDGRTLRPIFYHFALLEKQIYQKMQREKLYNLDKTAYFIVAFFVFKMDKILSDQISTVRKWDVFLIQAEFIFSYFILLLPDMFLKKNKIHHKMQCEK